MGSQIGSNRASEFNKYLQRSSCCGLAKGGLSSEPLRDGRFDQDAPK
jgi:hypothetical protein